MQPHHKEIIQIALEKMFNESSSFSICALDKLGDTLAVNPSNHEEYRFLRSLHCVDYSKMSNDLRQKLPQMVLATLTERFDTSLMARALDAVMTGEIKHDTFIEDYNPNLYKLGKT